MKIVLAGGTGFLGRLLSSYLASAGHDVVVLTRGLAVRNAIGRSVTWQPDGSAGPSWTAELADAGVIVNLSGANIAGKRWTEDRKTELRDSRILSTRSLVAALRSVPPAPRVLINGSAVGYYGDTGDAVVDESFPPGSDFLATLCVDWEAEARAAEALGCRVVLMRSGFVLGRGGVTARMTTPFKWFVGGPLGSGRQYVSWIHHEDWVALMEWTIKQPMLTGGVNATAPAPVTNEVFSRALGSALNRPSSVRVPTLALRIAFGELAGRLLEGQRVVPKRALEHGFRFKYTEITEAMRDATR
jgi:uncharacterized protein (TIGR01777 family)